MLSTLASTKNHRRECFANPVPYVCGVHRWSRQVAPNRSYENNVHSPLFLLAGCWNSLCANLRESAKSPPLRPCSKCKFSCPDPQIRRQLCCSYEDNKKNRIVS